MRKKDWNVVRSLPFCDLQATVSHPLDGLCTPAFQRDSTRSTGADSNDDHYRNADRYPGKIDRGDEQALGESEGNEQPFPAPGHRDEWHEQQRIPGVARRHDEQHDPDHEQ